MPLEKHALTTPRKKRSLHRFARRAIFLSLVLLLVVLLWLVASLVELRAGRRLWPWSAYALCGKSTLETLPETVHIGLYEEFPNPWRLAKLEQVDFPVTLAVATTSRSEFLQLREDILQTYPQVQEVYFWPLLSQEEGYYPGPWSDAEAIQRVAAEAEGLPVLWDLEPPLNSTHLTNQDWRDNRSFVPECLEQRTEPTHIWRPPTSMGLNPAFLRLIGMHYDPLDYPAVSLQLGLYATGEGLPSEDLFRILRCGVERYGDRFVPAFGVLDDGEGPEHIFVPPETLRRYLALARQAGVSEIWLFGSNGLNEEYLAALRETLPLESLPKE